MGKVAKISQTGGASTAKSKGGVKQEKAEALKSVVKSGRGVTVVGKGKINGIGANAKLKQKAKDVPVDAKRLKL